MRTYEFEKQMPKLFIKLFQATYNKNFVTNLVITDKKYSKYT